MIVNVNRFHRLVIHVDIPYLKRQVVTGQYVSPILRELDVRDRRDDLREEGFLRWIFFFLENYGIIRLTWTQVHSRFAC